MNVTRWGFPLLTLLVACSHQPEPRAANEVKAQWVVASYTECGPVALDVADTCDEASSDENNRLACIDRANQFNRELAEQGQAPVYFVTMVGR